MKTLEQYIAERRAINNKATAEWSARAFELSNLAKDRRLWSDPYGWIGEFTGQSASKDCNAAADARNEMPRVLDMLERQQKALDFYAKETNWDGDTFLPKDCVGLSGDAERDAYIPSGKRARELKQDLEKMVNE